MDSVVVDRAALLERAELTLARSISRVEGLVASARILATAGAESLAARRLVEAASITLDCHNEHVPGELMDEAIALEPDPELRLRYQVRAARMAREDVEREQRWEAVGVTLRAMPVGEVHVYAAYARHDQLGDRATELELTDLAQAHRELGWSQKAVALAAASRGDYLGGLAANRRALELARLHDDAELEMHSTYGCANCLIDLGRPSDAIAALFEAIHLAETLREHGAAVMYGLGLSSFLVEDLRTRRALEVLRSLEVRVKANGLDRWNSAVGVQLAWVLSAQGSHGVALDLSRAAFEASADARSAPENVLLPMIHAHVLLDGGAEAEEVAPVIQLAIEIAEASGHGSLVFWARFAQVKYLAWTDRLEEAATVAAAIADLEPSSTTQVACTLARCAAWHGRLEYLGRAVGIVSGADTTLAASDVFGREVLATMAASEGRLDDLRLIVEEWERSGRTGDADRTRLSIASLASGELDAARSGASARAHLAVDGLGFLGSRARMALEIHARTDVLSSGDVLSMEPGDSCVVIRGHLDLFAGDDGRVHVATLRSGDAFLQPLELDDGSYLPVAVDAADVMLLSRRDAIPLGHRFPELAEWLLASTARLAARHATMVHRLVHWPVEQRIIGALLELDELWGRAALPSGRIIDTHISGDRLGQRVGANRRSVTRALTDLRDRGWISMRGRKIMLGDIERLEAAIDDRRASA